MENRKSRETLKSFFRKGNTPTATHFEAFIDSVVNIADDGALRTKKDGLLIYPANENGRMASIYKGPELPDEREGIPCWSLRIGEEKEILLLNENEEVVVSLSQQMGAGAINPLPREMPTITSPLPQKETHPCRYLELPADGRWHDLLVDFTSSADVPGCRMLHVTAGYRSGKKKYCIVDLTAICCTGRRRKISPSQKRLFFWKSPLRVRWKKRKDGLFLQIKGKKKKHGEDTLHYVINELWRS